VLTVTKRCLLPSSLPGFVVPDSDSIDDSLSSAKELLRTFQVVSRGARKCLAVLEGMEQLEQQKEHGEAGERVEGGAGNWTTGNGMWGLEGYDMISAPFEFLMQRADWSPPKDLEDYRGLY
jgi:hypothetical protein